MQREGPESVPPDPDTREPYERPALIVVDLQAIEVLSSGCKMGSTTAAVASSCAGGMCSGEGS